MSVRGMRLEDRILGADGRVYDPVLIDLSRERAVGRDERGRRRKFRGEDLEEVDHGDGLWIETRIR